MPSIAKVVSTLFIFIYTSLVFGSDIITPYIPKFRLENLKLTLPEENAYFFQDSSGNLLKNKNFKNEIILKGEKRNTFYNLSMPYDSDSIAIEQDVDYLSQLNLRKSNNIFLLNSQSAKPVKIGRGVSPSLHLKSTWISYFVPDRKELILQYLPFRERVHAIAIQNYLHPYFRPLVAFPSNESVLYTDINESGSVVLMSYDLIKKNKSKIFETQIGHKLSFCLMDNYAYLLETGKSHTMDDSLTNIMQVDLKTKLAKTIVRYQENSGSKIFCHKNNIYFTKIEYDKDNLKNSYSLIQYNPISRINKVLQEFESSIHLFQSGKNFFISTLGKYFKVQL
ncbi:MAG: hypothetical protein H6621_05175 [Halobacteriovoraceae bacterium]|nr:hypothetical protein [Halobacteriovoraceae bacterium]